jgi:hypothetical protein
LVKKGKYELLSELIANKFATVPAARIRGDFFFMKRLTSGPNYEMAKMEALPLLSKVKYTELLKNIQEFEVTKDNLPQAEAILKAIRAAINTLETGRKQSGRALRLAVDEINSGYYLYVDPLKELLEPLAARTKELNDSAREENSVFEEDKLRVNGIKSELIAFVTSKVKEAGEAETPEKIVEIQKRAGSEKSRKNTYGEFIDTLVEIIAIMNPYFNTQKELIKCFLAVKEAPENASPLEIMAVNSQKAEIKQKMQENLAIMQDVCMKNVYEINVVEVETTLATARVRRISAHEVIDSEKLFKHHPEFFIIDEKQVTQYVKSRRNEVLAEKGNVIIENGLKMFILNKV